MLCPLKFSRAFVVENPPQFKLAQCEGIDCEWFNVDYGKCSLYLLALTPEEKVKLEHSNEGRKK